MRRLVIALVALAVARTFSAELLNADFENLKNRLAGAWSFTENGQSYEATFEAVAHGHAMLERNSGFIAVYYPDGMHSLLMTLYTRDGNQPRLQANGFGENPNSIVFGFKDITGWAKGTEHINGLELFFTDSDHLIEKWETLSPDGTKTHFEFELIRRAARGPHEK
ncbi:MAG TPA: hypothetical protein VFQ83_02955 [Candidatus Udaeobacter sp.]|jgi:hypothetical protein|nr:hypothetical protein [Candidatus Udaeobacter sp.]